MAQLKQLVGKITLLRGDNTTLFTLLMSAAAKLQKFSKVLFVDSANCFNPYLLKKLSPRDILPILRNILIARPFNSYQLNELVNTRFYGTAFGFHAPNPAHWHTSFKAVIPSLF